MLFEPIDGGDELSAEASREHGAIGVGLCSLCADEAHAPPQLVKTRVCAQTVPSGIEAQPYQPVRAFVICLVQPLERLGILPDAAVVLCGAPQEGALLHEIQFAAGTPAVVAAELGLRQLLAMSESAHSMISVDTGPAHAAAALGLPLVVMFGAESQRVWLPRSPSGSAVLGIGGPPVSSRVDQISVQEVVKAWCSLIR